MRFIDSYRQWSRAVRRGVVAAVAVVAGALALAAPSQAQASPVYEYQPIRLIVHDIEDWWPDNRDEPRMYYGGHTWADVVYNRETVDGARMPTARFTGSAMRIDLWERDNNWLDNNFLGSTLVQASVNEERHVTFGSRTNGYEYELVYRVVQVG